MRCSSSYVEKTDLQSTKKRRKEEQLGYQQKFQRKPPNLGLLGLRGPLGAMWAYSGPMRWLCAGSGPVRGVPGRFRTGPGGLVRYLGVLGRFRVILGWFGRSGPVQDRSGRSGPVPRRSGPVQGDSGPVQAFRAGSGPVRAVWSGTSAIWAGSGWLWAGSGHSGPVQGILGRFRHSGRFRRSGPAQSGSDRLGPAKPGWTAESTQPGPVT